MKLIVFFIIALLTLTYLVTFWQNKDKKVKFRFFNSEIEINLGLLAFGIFLDGTILSAIIIWLLY